MKIRHKENDIYWKLDITELKGQQFLEWQLSECLAW